MNLGEKISVIKTLKSKKWFFRPALFAGFVFTVFAIFTPPAFAAGFITAPISTNTIWTETGSPYVILGGVTVNSGVTLTIDPGTVVKFAGTNAQLIVNGTLQVSGIAANHVYFTSYQDDSIGGDSNGDGNATFSKAGDWKHIQINSGSVGNFKYADIRYAGGYFGGGSGAGVFNNGGALDFDNVSSSNNFQYGLSQASGFSIVKNSTFSDNLTPGQQSAGVYATGGILYLADNVFTNNGAVAHISGAVDLTHSGNTAMGNLMNAIVISGIISSNQTWNLDSLPYVANGITISSGKTLTINPGVVVKMGPNIPEPLIVNGTLKVNGAPDKKVYFTSFADGTIGGNTSGYSVTTPSIGDWAHIKFNPGSFGDFTDTIIRYGGGRFSASPSGAGIFNTGGAINLTNSQISLNSFYGVNQLSGSLTITRSEISNNRQNGINLIGGTANISQSSINDNNYPGWPNYSIYNSTANVVNAQNNWWGSPAGPYHPVLNPTGTTTSRVSDNVNFIPWLTSNPLFEEKRIDPAIIIPGILGSAEKNGEWVIDPIFHTYDDLIETLKANGYTEGKDLFTLPYDWRESNVLTALKLRDKINEVQGVCQCDKVDLVAHSMGGLTARQYIQSDKYENDVDQLIFLGTPHLGAPKAYLMWEGGESDLSFQDQFIKFVLSRDAQKAGFTSLFDYIRNRPIPSVQELLPVYDYLRDKSSGLLRTYPNNYPQNTFLENLRVGAVNLLDKVKVTNIVGDLGITNTINTIRVIDSPNPQLWEHGYPDGFDGSTADNGLERGSGDKTVPSISGEFIASDLNVLTAEHNALTTRAEGLVFKKLTNKNPSILIDNGFYINPKLLLIKILSPVDVVVVAPDGKRIGKDFDTNQEINEIAGAFYSGFLTDNEYLTIPNPLDGEYKIQAKGTGSGSYTVATGYISDNISVDKGFTAQTQPGMTTELNLVVNNETPINLDIKPKDITPPEIAAVSPQSKDYLRSETIPVSVIISDTESGVFSQSIKFDDRVLNNGEIIDLFFEKLGNHNLTVTASDFVGNSASTTVNFRIVATIQSTIYDIERAYSLGWIDNLGIKKSLIKKLKEADKKEKEKGDKDRKEKEPDGHKSEEPKEKHSDKHPWKEFLKELEAQKGKHINEQAYVLLKENIDWLLNN